MKKVRVRINIHGCAFFLARNEYNLCTILAFGPLAKVLAREM